MDAQPATVVSLDEKKRAELAERGDQADQEQWDRVCGLLRREIGESSYRSWLKPMSFAQNTKGKVTIAVPTAFLRDWAVMHYEDRLLELWQQENPAVHSIDIIVNNKPPKEKPPTPAPAPPRPAPNRLVVPIKTEERQTRKRLERLNPKYIFETFVVGPSNRLAYAAAVRAAESYPSGVSYSPLYVHGPVGLGKTHLLQAIVARKQRQMGGGRPLYMSAERFMYEFVRAIRSKDMMTFKELTRNVGILVIDDIQFISGKRSTQEEFLHACIALFDAGGQLVVSADVPPSQLTGIDERLRSRLTGGLTVGIEPLEYDTRRAILTNKVRGLLPQIDEETLDFLASRVTNNVRELEGMLNRIVAQGELTGNAPNLKNVAELIRQVEPQSYHRITIDHIQKRVAQYFDLTVKEMLSHRRSQVIARPRQIAMYLCKAMTRRSLPEIGHKFGNRDHTTVMHAVRRIESLIAKDAGMHEDVVLLKRLVES
ncbi:MAG: chromosomal replication initiator protein DnaA [Pseudomonadota bacterium]